MRPRPRHRTTLAVLAAGVALTGCAALSGDAPPSATAGIAGAGDVAASAFDGDVVVTARELETVVELVAGDDDLVLGSTPEGVEQLVPFQRQVLEVLIEQAVYASAAEEQFGITVDDDDIEASIATTAEEVGGMDALEEQLEAAGSSLEIEREINRRFIVLNEQLREALLDGATGDGAGLVSDWELEQLMEADVLVARRFGAWNEAGLTVVPVDQAGSQAAL